MTGRTCTYDSPQAAARPYTAQVFNWVKPTPFRESVSMIFRFICTQTFNPAQRTVHTVIPLTKGVRAAIYLTPRYRLLVVYAPTRVFPQPTTSLHSLSCAQLFYARVVIAL